MFFVLSLSGICHQFYNLLWAYLMKVIAETRVYNKLDIHVSALLYKTGDSSDSLDELYNS
jgi:hypothetical protein